MYISCCFVLFAVKGILIYEVLCGAYPESHDGRDASNLPWHGMSFVEIISHVTRGERPEVPQRSVSNDNVLHAVLHTDIMAQCLQGAPTDRPTFDQILQQLRSAA
jgi:Protein tyrosine and serine/threonine kinase